MQLGEPTRLNLAKLVATEGDGRLLRELADRFRLNVYFAADGVEKHDSSGDVAKLVEAVRELSAAGPDSQATRLGDAVQQVLNDSRGAPLAAVLLFTDGVTTEGMPLASASTEARRTGVPIFAVGLGSSRAAKGHRTGRRARGRCRFRRRSGELPNANQSQRPRGPKPARVVLRREGEATPLAEETVTLPPAGETITTLLVHRPTAAGEISV